MKSTIYKRNFTTQFIIVFLLIFISVGFANLKAQSIKIIQTKKGEVKLMIPAIDKVVSADFANQILNYNSTKKDSITLLYVSDGVVTDSVRQHINNLSFQFKNEKSSGVMGLFLESDNRLKEKFIKTGTNSYHYSYSMEYTEGCYTGGGLVFNTSTTEYLIYTANNRIIKTDTYGTFSSSANKRSTPRQFGTRTIYKYNSAGNIASKTIYNDTLNQPSQIISYQYKNKKLTNVVSKVYKGGKVEFTDNNTYSLNFNYKNGQLAYKISSYSDTSIKIRDAQLDTFSVFYNKFINLIIKSEKAEQDENTSDSILEKIGENMDNAETDMLDLIDRFNFSGYYKNRITQYLYHKGNLISVNEVKDFYEYSNFGNSDSLYYDTKKRIIKHIRDDEFIANYEYSKTGQLSYKKVFSIKEYDKNEPKLKYEEWYSYDKKGNMSEIKLNDNENERTYNLKIRY